MVKLGEVASYINGYAFKPEDRGSEGLPIIRIQDLTGNSYDLGYYSGNYPKKIEINDGDILISWSASLGVYTWNKGKALLNQHIFKVEFIEDSIDKKYFVYAVRKKIDEMIRKSHGATMKHIIKKDFEDTIIPYPTLEEQYKIADELDRISKIIDMRNQELRLHDDLIRARFVEMFGEGLKDDGKFKLKPISEIGQVVSGATPKTSRYEYWNGDNVWITPAELSDESFVIYDSERKLTYEGVDSCAVTLLPVGTVILSSRAPIGKVAIAGVEMYCNQGFKNIIPRNVVSSIYLYELLKMETEYLKSLGRGATFKEISKQIVENIRVKVPPIELQNQFATFVNHVNKSKVEVKRALDEAQLLFDSLMQKYFG